MTQLYRLSHAAGCCSKPQWSPQWLLPSRFHGCVEIFAGVNHKGSSFPHSKSVMNFSSYVFKISKDGNCVASGAAGSTAARGKFRTKDSPSLLRLEIWKKSCNLLQLWKRIEAKSQQDSQKSQRALAVSSFLLTASKVRPITSTLSSTALCDHFNTSESLCLNSDLTPNSSGEKVWDDANIMIKSIYLIMETNYIPRTFTLWAIFLLTKQSYWKHVGLSSSEYHTVFYPTCTAAKHTLECAPANTSKIDGMLCSNYTGCFWT